MVSHVFTSVASNYLPKARVLARSLKRFHPDYPFHVVLCDRFSPGLLGDDEPFDSVVPVAELAGATPDWIFKHSLVELSTAVKGMMLERLLSEPGAGRVLYFDPDIVVLHSLDKLVAEFERSSVLLTPHQTVPEESRDTILDNEICSLKHGVFNLGFLGVKNSAAGRQFAKWWADRLREFCYADIPNGIFTDQRWVDLAPAFFDDLGILRDASYNVSTWNLSHREVTGDLHSGLLVNGSPLVFYHFSGFDSGAQEIMLNKYGARMPALWKLRKWYVNECARLEQAKYAAIPWFYGYFDNGREITGEQRLLYRDRADLQQAFPNPFSAGKVNSSYYHWFEADRARIATVSGPPPDPQTPRERLERAAALPIPPPYRVFVSMGRDEVELALATLSVFEERTHSTEPIFLIGPEAAVSCVLTRAGVTSGRLQPILLPEGSNHADSLERVLRDFANCDFAFVMAGVLVPDLWDIRLAWSAQYIEGVATVSPMCERGTDAGADAGRIGADTQNLDYSCYQKTNFAHPETKYFLQECFFARTEALQAMGEFPPGVFERGNPFKSLNDVPAMVRYVHVVADHMSVCTIRSGPSRTPEAEEAGLAETAKGAPARPSAEGRTPSQNNRRIAPPRIRARARNLHVMHSWGGGLDRWVQQYCRADTGRENLILKSVGLRGAVGMQLDLYGAAHDPRLLESWPLTPPIKGTALENRDYEHVLHDIVERHGIERVIVSSLIGHSIEALATGLPTLFVCHDFYPWCPAINIVFNGICTSCGQRELTACSRHNPHSRFFDNLPPRFWIQLRQDLLARTRENPVLFVAPSESARRHWLQLAPELKDHFAIIPHGSEPLEPVPSPPATAERKLRLLVLGNLAPHKGRFLMEEIVQELLSFADLYLLGCEDDGEQFANLRGVTVKPKYQWAELQQLVREIQPDAGLLLSVFPETFCFTLQEFFEMRIPPVATRVGSFVDRIQDGVNGFLCDPNGAGILNRLRDLAADRSQLDQVRRSLGEQSHRTTEEMVADYEGVLKAPSFSARSYFLQPDGNNGARSGPVTSALYWRAEGADFSETMSSRVRSMPTPEKMRVRLAISSQAEPIVQLRLDIADRPGLILLESVSLHDSLRNLVWRGEGPELLRKGQFSGIIQVQGSGEESGQLLFLTNQEPSLHLPIDPEALGKMANGGVLEVEYCWPPPSSHPSAIRQLLRGQGTRELQPVERETMIAHLSEEEPVRPTHPLDARFLAEARQRIANIEKSLSWRVTAPLRWAGKYAIRVRAQLSRQ